MDSKEGGTAKILVDSLSQDLKVTRSAEPPRASARGASAPAWVGGAVASADDEPPWVDDEPPPWDMEMDDSPSAPPTPAGQGAGGDQAAPVKPNGNGNGRAPAPSPAGRANSPAERPPQPQPVEPVAVSAPPSTVASPTAGTQPVGSKLGVREPVVPNGKDNGSETARPAPSNGKRNPSEPARLPPASNGNGGAARAAREQTPAYVAAPRQKVTITFHGSGDRDRDVRVMRRAHGLLTSYSGQDEFEFVIYEEGMHGSQVRFPNDSTGYCDALAQQLSTLLGPGCVDVSPL